MEIFNYNNITNTKQVSTVAVFKQREKLDSRIFVDLNDEMMKMFYHKCNKETKKYKDYVLIAIDGSDLEIPNTKATRKEYNGNLQEHCARITVSTCYDILNKYTIDTIIKPYNYSETDMAIEHYNTLNDKNIFGKQKTIFIMDRGYVSLSNMFDVDNGGGKFVIRLSTKGYQEEITKMKTDDEIIEIKPTSLRMNRARKNNPKLYNHFTEGKSVYVRCVRVVLPTGEVEHLFTNLPENQFNFDEIKELYRLRWQIEINYGHLKNNVQIENITSSKDLLIKQDILSQIYVANILQSFINEAENKIEQVKYKYKQKINKRMATGIFKNNIIYIILEKDNKKRSKMALNLIESMLKYLVSVIDGRHYPRNNNPKNKHNLNQRRTF